jgi:hypothetical protein
MKNLKLQKSKSINSKIFNSFEFITPSHSYSKNGLLFEKIIQYRSFKTLINKLMNPVKPVKMSFIEEMKVKYPYGSTSTGIQEEYFSDFNGKMKNIEIDLPIEQNNTKKVKNHNYNLYYTKNYGSMNIYKQVDNINLDPFKYNPNYNSIYKNIPCVKISSPSKEYLQAKMKKNKILIYRNNNLFYHKKREHSSSGSKNIDIDDNKKENNKNPTNNNIIFDYNKERQAITNFNNKTLKKFNSLSPKKFNFCIVYIFIFW